MKKTTSPSNPTSEKVACSKLKLKKRYCFFCVKDLPVDYKDTEHLRDFITRSGKIMPRRLTGLCAKHQRALCRAIKQARTMALLPFVRMY